ncbi:hypothetical protein ACWELJ_30790 [Nocardia sp. NPDC004582]
MTPQPPPAAVTAALERLGNPADRLIAELFWFWPTDYVDPATDGIDRAGRLWLERMPTDPIAAHNLAVLRHIEALETPRGAHPETWLDALTAWDTAIAAAETWHWLGERAAQLGLHRYRPGSGGLRQLREQLPAAVLRIHTNVIAHAIPTGQMATAELQFAVLDEFRAQIVMYPSVFDFTDIDFARDQYARQLRLFLRCRGDQVRRVAEERPKDTLPEVRNLLVEEGRARAYRRGTAIEDSATEPVVDSRVVGIAIECVAAYYNATKDLAGACDVLNLMRTLAVGEAGLADLEGATRDLETKWREYLCEFCGKRRGVVAAEHVVRMHRERLPRRHGDPEFERTEIVFPRCRRCRVANLLEDPWLAIATLMALSGLGLGIKGLISLNAGGWPTLVTGVAIYVAAVAGTLILASMSNPDRVAADPRIRRLHRDRWRLS